jgi:hypothetical protein
LPAEKAPEATTEPVKVAFPVTTRLLLITKVPVIVSPVLDTLLLLEEDTLAIELDKLAKSVTRFVTWLSAICIDVEDKAVTLPLLSIVIVGVVVAEPIGPIPVKISFNVGFGYEPVRSPPAGPDGEPPPPPAIDAEETFVMIPLLSTVRTGVSVEEPTIVFGNLNGFVGLEKAIN